MQTKILNFCNMSPVEVVLVNSAGGKLVAVYQRGEAMTFQHTMTPDQAEQMADALRVVAAEARGPVARATPDPSLVSLVQEGVPSFGVSV